MNQRRLYAALSCGIGGVLLTGCGAAKDVVNNNIPAVDNMLQLDGASVDANINGSRALISGSSSRTVTFADRSLPQKDQLHFVKFEQAVENSVSVTVPSGVALPDSFPISNLTLQLTVSDGNEGEQRSANVTGTYAGPVTYTRTARTNDYTANKDVSYKDVEISGDSFKTFRNIVTTAPEPNSATAKISLDTDDTFLPKGSVITFKFKNGKARVGI